MLGGIFKTVVLPTIVSAATTGISTGIQNVIAPPARAAAEQFEDEEVEEEEVEEE